MVASVRSVVVMALALATACTGDASSTPDLVQRFDGFLGERVTVAEARMRVDYAFGLPTAHPTRSRVKQAYVAGADPDTAQVVIEYRDGTFIEFLPRPDAPDYDARIALSGDGSLVQVRGTTGYGLEPSDRGLGFLRWFEGGLEHVIGGPHPVARLVEMAASI